MPQVAVAVAQAVRVLLHLRPLAVRVVPEFQIL
jgi:hypothetical protein